MSSLADRAWTATDYEAVAAMILEGASMRQIASEFAITRNAVIGRIHRDCMLMRLMKRQGYRPPKPKPKPLKPPRKKPPPLPVIPEFHRDWGAWEEREALCKMRKEGIEPEVFGPDAPAGKPLLKLNRYECRWPIKDDPQAIGGYLFCSASTEADHSYCPRHEALSRPPGRREQ